MEILAAAVTGPPAMEILAAAVTGPPAMDLSNSTSHPQGRFLTVVNSNWVSFSLILVTD